MHTVEHNWKIEFQTQPSVFNTCCSAFWGVLLCSSNVPKQFLCFVKNNTWKQHVLTSRMCTRMWVLNSVTTEPCQLAETAQPSPRRRLESCGEWTRLIRSITITPSCPHRIFRRWRSVNGSQRRTPQPHTPLVFLTSSTTQEKSLFTSRRALRRHRRWETRWHQTTPLAEMLEEKLTFVLQRVAGSYFHSPAYWLSRTVNDLVVGKSDIKFLKLSHGSAPHRQSAAPSLWKREEALLRSHLLPRAPLETSDVTLTKTHFE